MCTHELLLRPEQGDEPDDNPIDADGIATSAWEAEGPERVAPAQLTASGAKGCAAECVRTTSDVALLFASLWRR